jgi:hypothetical protein
VAVRQRATATLPEEVTSPEIVTLQETVRLHFGSVEFVCFQLVVAGSSLAYSSVFPWNWNVDDLVENRRFVGYLNLAAAYIVLDELAGSGP